jgi:holo-[acyl-carrier protein] synthase
MVLRSGIDLIEIDRFQRVLERFGDRFLGRVFTQQELEETRRDTASLAARFAAKEAVSKALGTGIGAVSWHEIEIRRGPAREPVLHLHGAAYELAQEQHLTTWSVSLSHSQRYAVALAVTVGRQKEI